MPDTIKPNRQARRAAKAARRSPQPMLRRPDTRTPLRAQTRGGRPKRFPGRTGGR